LTLIIISLAQSIMLFARQAVTASKAVSRTRLFATSTAVRRDPIQELYIRELKGFKPAPQAKDAHVGIVKEYAIPLPPTPPSLPVNLASELAAYDATDPIIATPVAAPVADEGGASGAEAFLSFLEQDIPKAEAHH